MLLFGNGGGVGVACGTSGVVLLVLFGCWCCSVPSDGGDEVKWGVTPPSVGMVMSPVKSLLLAVFVPFCGWWCSVDGVGVTCETSGVASLAGGLVLFGR